MAWLDWLDGMEQAAVLAVLLALGWAGVERAWDWWTRPRHGRTSR